MTANGTPNASWAAGGMAHSIRARVVLLFAALLIGSTAAAQSRLTVLTASSTSRPDTTFLFQLPSQRLEWSGSERLLSGVFTASGRYFISTKETTDPFMLKLWVGDLGTGHVRTEDLPSYNGAYVVANPRFDEVYMVLVSGADGHLVAVTPTAMRPLGGCAPMPPAVSSDGTTLFCYESGGHLIAFDTATGAEIRRVPIGATGLLVTDATGSTVTAWRPTGLTTYDARTGAVLRSAPLPL